MNRHSALSEASRTACSSAISSNRSVTRICFGRPSSSSADLDCGADVVGVDVAVPQPIATDHHDRVPDFAPRLLELLNAFVEKIDEIHHLIAQFADIDASIHGVPTRHHFQLLETRPIPPRRDPEAAHHRRRTTPNRGTAGIPHRLRRRHRHPSTRGAVLRVVAVFQRHGGTHDLGERTARIGSDLGRLGALRQTHREDRALDRRWWACSRTVSRKVLTDSRRATVFNCSRVGTTG